MARKVMWTESAWRDLKKLRIILLRILPTMQQHLFVKHGKPHGHWPVWRSGVVQSPNLMIRVSESFL